MKYISFICSNGLGDKMLDVIGAHVLCDYLGYTPNIKFNKDYEEHFDWGTNQYDIRLFDKVDAFQNTNHCNYYLKSPNPSCSLSPYKVYRLLLESLPDLSFKEVNNKYRELATNLIKPSPIVQTYLPKVLQNTYGIHLRKTDKIKIKNCDIRHENKIDEFAIIIEELLNSIRQIIEKEENPTFLIVSEDEVWKKTITEMIKEMSNKITFIELDYSQKNQYTNFKSVLDMFALSKCKTILQGVKYSSYSILAALLGNKKLVNYSHFLESNSECLIYTWNSLIEINEEIIDQHEFYKLATCSILDPIIHHI